MYDATDGCREMCAHQEEEQQRHRFRLALQTVSFQAPENQQMLTPEFFLVVFCLSTVVPT